MLCAWESSPLISIRNIQYCEPSTAMVVFIVPNKTAVPDNQTGKRG